MSWYELIHFDHLSEAQSKHKKITTNEQERSTIALLRMMNMEQTGYIWVHSVMQVKEATDTTTQPVIVCTNQVLSDREAQVMRSNSWLYQFYSLHSKAHCNFSSNSPIHVNQTETPNSVCSESDDRSDVKPNIRTTINASTLPVGVELAKSPPAAIMNNGGNSNQGDSGPSPARSSEAFQAIQENYIGINGSSNTANNTSYNGYQAASIQQHSSSINNKSSAVSSKLSPITHSPSSSSNISSSPLSSSSLYPQQQRYHQLTSSNMMNPLLGSTNQSTDIHHHHHNSNSVGSSSASSTSSSSSNSSTSSTLNEISTTPTTNLASHNVAQSMAVAAAAGSTAAASLYAGIEAIDPLQHMHHSAHHHHSMYSAATGHQHHSSHTAAAVNYANQVMAAQRVAHQQSHHHHHHHPYHPYHHHHHYQPQPTHSHQVAPHHHSHHTTPHALYAPSHHHAAAYHSAAAVAAATSAHPAHTGTIENPYHPASAAAAAAAHQGVSFHKIVAAVNASA